MLHYQLAGPWFITHVASRSVNGAISGQFAVRASHRAGVRACVRAIRRLGGVASSSISCVGGQRPSSDLHLVRAPAYHLPASPPPPSRRWRIQAGPKKWGHRLMTIILPSLNLVLLTLMFHKVVQQYMQCAVGFLTPI